MLIFLSLLGEDSVEIMVDPSEKGIYEDARSAVRWLKNKGIVEKNIIIYGESLGTGAAVEIAQNNEFCWCNFRIPFYIHD